METALDEEPRKTERPATGADESVAPLRIEPDLEFIQSLRDQTGSGFKKCFQCATCSATCALSPETDPFPRKEMAWAAWGMREQLLSDPDVWLCHQCNDCTTACPRGGGPGDVLSAVRREQVIHYAFPRFLARWAAQARFMPLLVALPAAVLTLALYVGGPLGEALGFTAHTGAGVVYSYSQLLPHWLLNTVFLVFSALSLLVAVAGIRRMWRALKTSRVGGAPVKSLGASVKTVLKEVVTHRRFGSCETAKSRRVSHMCVFFGFAALTLVTLWVITAQVNPLARGDFIYPFGFWNPWKLLANAGGAALLLGCSLMILDRLKDLDNVGTYFDWALVLHLLLAVVTGFATEVLHYLRLEPHRHIVYFGHLVVVLGFVMVLPYSKLAHVFYRATAMVYAELTGRRGRRDTAPEPVRATPTEEEAR